LLKPTCYEQATYFGNYFELIVVASWGTIGSA